MGDATFTLDSVERALTVHVHDGLIKEWHRDRRTVGNCGTHVIPLYWVTTSNGWRLALANIWEAHAFVNGIATTRQAYLSGKVNTASDKFLLAQWQE